MDGLEEVYRRHHTKNNNRKRNHAILSAERKAFIQKKLGSNKRVLDIGCRDGELIMHYNDHHSILGLDIDQEALLLAKQKTGIDTRYCDLNSDWNVTEASFDAVVACEVIEHLYHPPVVFERINRALKPGGILVGSVPHAFNIQTRMKFLFGIKRLTPLSDPTHINHFSAPEIKSLLSEQFVDVVVVGISTKKYRIFQKVFPFLFTHTLLFSAYKVVQK